MSKHTGPYDYSDFREDMLTDEGQRMVIKAIKKAEELFKIAGAAEGYKIIQDCGASDSFTMIAVLDRLKELGEIKEIGEYPKYQWGIYTEP